MSWEKLLESSKPSQRITRIIDEFNSTVPQVEAERAILVTESYKETENKPMVIRRALALEKILNEMPIVIRDEELIVGNLTKKAKSSQIFPEYSNKWLLDEFDKLNQRTGDLFTISDETVKQLKEVFTYWDGKTVNELACSYMMEDTLKAMKANVFTVNNYFFNGVGHISVDYSKVLSKGFKGVIAEAEAELSKINVKMPDFAKRRQFLEAVIITSKAAINFAHRFAKLALEMSQKENDFRRKKELLQIADVCSKVPENRCTSFYEAVQAFWFVHAILQIESNGHSVSPMRFDQYMYPFYKIEKDNNTLNNEFAQELLDCLFIKLNEINKVRDEASTKAFGGYPMFQNLIVGGQTSDGKDATNELSFMCLEATNHTRMAQPSISVRVWEHSPDELLIKAAKITALGTGMPAYYNDLVIIPALVHRGVSLEDARDYGIIGCVEPQKGGKTEGWHDSGFFNLAKAFEITLNGGKENGEQVGLDIGKAEDFTSFEQVLDAYKKQMEHFVMLLADAENSVDNAHAERAPLPFVSSLVDDCIAKGKSIQEGGAHYNFTGPQGVGVANVGDSLEAIKKLVFEDKLISMKELKKALDSNFETSADNVEAAVMIEVSRILYEKGVIDKDTLQSMNSINTGTYKNGEYIRQILINKAPKFGNDIPEVDSLAREAALIYCREVEKYENPRGGRFQPGLYPASINVAMGAVTGATADGRKAGTPLADGVSPTAGRDKLGPTAVMNSVAKLDHFIASNGTLLNQKFHPSVMEGESGYQNFINLIKGYFAQYGMHVQFNVVSKEILLEAQKNPEKYKNLVVRVAGYSAQFITLDKSIQDDIINRTEQTF